MNFDSIEVREIIKRRNFDYYRKYQIYGNETLEGFLETKDKCKLVKCTNCDLVFTNPVFDIDQWEKYLKDTSNPDMSRIAGNRYQYGVAHKKNARNVDKEVWLSGVNKKNIEIIRNIELIINRKIKFLHEIGCGMGFLLEDAIKEGITSTGNELNGASCEIMKNLMELSVYNDNVENCNLPENFYDAFVMDDVLEHVYHPRVVLETVLKSLNPGGAAYIETFVIDCKAFDEKKGEWNFLFWNHVTHFSRETLKKLLDTIGFREIHEIPSGRDHIVTYIALK